ncbi:MAG: hypothetical protein GC137_01345 [Alphaproteobacteria bacterium]|nr:hypothetical protein [Alphaproteobacteria bacterium]
MSFNVLAQSENATDKSETNIFEIATEEQMQEAREFYQFCKDDPIYSERKNCKCASLRYLETRVEHGDKISKAEILEKNKEACIRSIEGNLEVTKKVDVEEIPQKYIAEAEGIYMECKNDPLHAREYDCNCYAANYLEKRIEGGEFTNQNLIKLNIRGKCPNLVEKTGYEYTQCMSTYMLASAPPGIEAQDFCECYARTWAEQTKNSQGTVSNSAKMQLQVTSRMACRDPALYQTERK